MQRLSGNQAIRTLLDELKYLRQMIASTTKQIRVLAREEPYLSFVDYLVTVPGISTLAAMILLTELVTLGRFDNLDKLASYVGLVPGEHSSGESEITTGITCRRNAFLRGLLIECAWVAAKKDPAMSLAFSKLSKRMPKNQAIVHIAHKLLNRIRYVMKNRAPYVPAVVS